MKGHPGRDDDPQHRAAAGQGRPDGAVGRDQRRPRQEGRRRVRPGEASVRGAAAGPQPLHRHRRRRLQRAAPEPQAREGRGVAVDGQEASTRIIRPLPPLAAPAFPAARLLAVLLRPKHPSPPQPPTPPLVRCQASQPRHLHEPRRPPSRRRPRQEQEQEAPRVPDWPQRQGQEDTQQPADGQVHPHQPAPGQATQVIGRRGKADESRPSGWDARSSFLLSYKGSFP